MLSRCFFEQIMVQLLVLLGDETLVFLVCNFVFSVRLSLVGILALFAFISGMWDATEQTYSAIKPLGSLHSHPSFNLLFRCRG